VTGEEDRTKTVTWSDPAAHAATTARMSGLELMKAFLDGSVPPAPITKLLGFALVSVSEGEVVFRGTPDDSMYNPIGLVHGGLVCTLLDSAAGCAVHSTLPTGTGYSSVEIKVSYLRPVRSGEGDLIATGRLVKGGRRIAFAEADVRDEQGRLVATASSSCLIFSL
jgi:uncharacterized protein (TIGR00369 family)